MPLGPGSPVAGYRIESLVGRGGMGVVYRAVQLGLDRVVALKVIAPELLEDADVRRRFLAEARSAAGVEHPNVIPVYEAGEDDGVAYIAMRFVPGHDLRSLVRRAGLLDPARAAGVIAQAAAALDAIHRAGFVHRDVKPGNLLVDADGHVYLTDFGLAKQIVTRSGATRTGQWVGTLDYVAPEQIRGARIDARTDVYALGGVLHYALTGRVPFERDGDEAKLWAQLSAPPPVPSELRPELRPELDAVVARAMAKAPEERFPSAGDLARAALAAASGTAPTEPERMVARGAAAPDESSAGWEVSTRTALPAASGEPAAGARPRRPGPRGLVVAALAVVALTAAGIAAASAMRSDDPPAGARATPTATASPAPGFTTRTTERIGDRPSGLALAGDELWVLSSNSDWLTLVSAETGKELDEHVKAGSDVRSMVSYRDDVWLTRASTREVLRVDARSRRVVDTIATPGIPTRVAVDRSGVWVAVTRDTDAQAVQRYNASGRLLQTIAVREGVEALLAAAGAIWIVKASSHKLARLRPGADQFDDWAAFSAAVAGLSFGDGALWATLPSEDAVARVEARTGRLTIGSAGRSPGQVVHAGGRAFVSSRNDSTVVVLDPETLRPVGDAITGVGLNPFALETDGRSVWVTGLADNSLTRIDYG